MWNDDDGDDNDDDEWHITIYTHWMATFVLFISPILNQAKEEAKKTELEENELN